MEKKVALDTWARALEGILKAKPAAVLPFSKKDPIRADADPQNADWPKKTRDLSASGKPVRRKAAKR